LDVARNVGATHVRVFGGQKPPAPRWSKPSDLVGLEYEGTADPATAVPSHLRRLKELAVKYSE